MTRCHYSRLYVPFGHKDEDYTARCLPHIKSHSQFSLFCFNQRAVRKVVVRFELFEPRSYLSTLTSMPRYVMFLENYY